MSIDPDILHFFREELEKEAGSPDFALRHMGNKGVRGTIARAFARTPWEKVNPVIHEMDQGAQLFGPQFALATLKGRLKGGALKKGLKGIKNAPQMTDAATWYERNVPSHLFDSPVYEGVKRQAGALGQVLGL